MVHTVFSALGSCVCGEVKHIPYMSCPKIRTNGNLLNQFLVVVSLILLGIISLGNIRCVPIKSLTAVLAYADSLVRILLVELIKPRTVHINITAVPAEVMIIGHNIADVHIFIIHTAHGYNRLCCGTGLVHRMNKVIKHLMIFNNGRRCTAHCNLV